MIRILICFLLSFKALACTDVLVPSELNMALDPKNESFYFYNDLRAIHDRPSISAENCFKTAASNKYLMFAVSLENFVLSDEFLTYSINDDLTMQGDSCSLKNSPVEKLQTKDERNQRLRDRRDLLNSCIVYQVTDFSKAGLVYPEKQPGCSVERISNNAANFKGPFCFFKPNVDSSIVLSFDVAPECLSYDFFRSNKIKTSDALGMLAIYEAGDASGKSSDLTALKQLPYRVSVNADENVVKTNSDIGDKRPTWPTTWPVSNLFLAEPKIVNSSTTYDEIYFPIFVSNICERKCVNDLCSSACDYSQPVVAEYALYENVKGKKSLVTAWFDGGVAPANWQGILQGVGAKLQKGLLVPEVKYTVEINFKDQELNYLGLKGRIEKQIRMNPNQIPGMRHGGTSINEIPTFNNIGEIGKLPLIKDIQGIYFNGKGFTGVKDALRSISRFFKSSFWPPYFEEVCNGNSCVKNDKYVGKLILDFTLIEKNKKLKVSEYTFSREGTFFGSTRYENYQFPKKDCGFGTNDDEEELPDFDF